MTTSVGEDYNPNDWVPFRVSDARDIPTGPHFAGIMLDTRVEITPAQDLYDADTYRRLPDTTYFAFPDKEALQRWVLLALKDKKTVFFFEVKTVGRATLKVDVNLET